MQNILTSAIALMTGLFIVFVWPDNALGAEKRIALVVGNANYNVRALHTPANDAGLIAQTLQAAGFDVIGARDLDEDSLRHALRDFVDKASASGGDTVAFIYFAGYGLQLEGENYLVPVDARISRYFDLAAGALRISDYMRPLAALKLKATILVLDATRANPFTVTGQPLAGSLALVEPSPGMLVAMNAAPGTIASDEPGPYGAYAKALNEMMREGGLSLDEVFDRVRLRVNELTKGAEVPWHASNVKTSFVFLERAADAPQSSAAVEKPLQARPIGELHTSDAYWAALKRDTLQGYDEFLAAYPNDPLANRVRAIIAARREAIIWRRTHNADAPNAYWSYLRRYPHGPHAEDVRRRLSELSAATQPPNDFPSIDYDVPPPAPEETGYVEGSAVDFAEWHFGPLPSAPSYVLPPTPPDLAVLPEPWQPETVYALPVPGFVPIPIWFSPPRYVTPPPNSIIFNNIHNKIVLNRTNNVATITNNRGEDLASMALRRPGFGTSVIEPRLPPAVARKVALFPQQGLSGAAINTRVKTTTPLPASSSLPGESRHQLPQIDERTSPAARDQTPSPHPAAGGLPATTLRTPRSSQAMSTQQLLSSPRTHDGRLPAPRTATAVAADVRRSRSQATLQNKLHPPAIHRQSTASGPIRPQAAAVRNVPRAVKSLSDPIASSSRSQHVTTNQKLPATFRRPAPPAVSHAAIRIPSAARIQHWPGPTRLTRQHALPAPRAVHATGTRPTPSPTSARHPGPAVGHRAPRTF
jgi:uncharacterized caspase-like protein